ncbi:SAM-dependent methyltransferase, partial [Bacillus anthracis]|nr:SAM-dependent methyltransferase [Bacillus anthracis]
KMSLTKKLQEVSAKCVKQVEVIRAQRLLNGRATTSGYFENIEHCINEEFGRWQIGKNDKLLLIGSGAYPMTLIQVAKETGAAVIGIDIDSEAVDLGQRVVNVLAPNEDIVISNQTVDQLEDIQSVTHIIFSSTIPIKYDILNELYTLTNDEVVVAMRYGDDIKAL